MCAYDEEEKERETDEKEDHQTNHHGGGGRAERIWSDGVSIGICRRAHVHRARGWALRVFEEG